jgi:hypothetical protein
MEFNISLAGARPDLARLQSVIAAVDPAAVVDCDPFGQQLRVSTVLSTGELKSLTGQAGLVLTDAQIEPRPSNCCGGCGG